MSGIKLHPPIIEGTIPAFYGNVIRVPFFMNKAVSQNQINGFSLKIKTVQSNYYLGNPQVIYNSVKNTVEHGSYVISNVDCYVEFELSQTLINKLNIGQFYKIQLAYLNKDNTPCYYSTVGVVKYTAKPEITILDMTDGTAYTGRYYQSEDKSEKVYSYRFDLKDNQGVLIETSGEQLHNNSFDTEINESIDTYTVKTDLKKGKIYYLTYTVTTINGLVEPAYAKRIIKTESIDSNLKADIKLTLNHEDGCISLDLVGHKNEKGVEYSAVGQFILLRASDEDNYSTWNEVLRFVLYGQQPSRHLWDDMTVKQGVNYKYAIQQYNQHRLKSNKIESNIIYADFEHAFLYDGQKQLKIKYNPKVSSFKNTLLENKVDTIGSKHPFIFRNGSVNYKEFPISGLISHLSDENNFFNNKSFFLDEERKVEYIKEQPEEGGVSKEIWKSELKNPILDFNNRKIKTTNATADNVHLERNFKLEVLEWLTNGQPKLFRSPTEGNYIVRLLNVSLTPTDSLGRMLHTFNCTAYEIAEYSYDNLNKFGLITTKDPTTAQLRWETIELSKTGIKDGDNILNHPASAVRFEGMVPGDKIWIDDGIKRGLNYQTGYSIVIGVTGSYIIELDNNVSIHRITFEGSPDNIKDSDGSVRHQGTLTYAYYSTEYIDSFDSINNISVSPIPCEQYIGEHDIIKEIENIKDNVQSIASLRIYLRDAEETIYQQENGIFTRQFDKNSAIVYPTETLNIYKLYYIFQKINHNSNLVLDVFLQPDGTYSYDMEGQSPASISVVFNYRVWDWAWYDGYNKKLLGKEFDPQWTKVYFNEIYEMDLIDTFSYEITTPQDLANIKTGAALICEIAYQKKTISYELENVQPTKQHRDEWQQAYNQLQQAIKTQSNSEIREMQEKNDMLYKDFLVELEKAIQESERR